MLIYKITLTILGENFTPTEILSKLSKGLNVINYHSPSDLFDEFSGEEYGFGMIMFMHPKKIVLSNDASTYQYDFISFLEDNYKTPGQRKNVKSLYSPAFVLQQRKNLFLAPIEIFVNDQ